MKINNLLIFAFLGAILLNSCSDDDSDFSGDGPEPSQGTYDNGFFVLNEGGGGAPGSVTFANNTLDSVQQHVYTSVNGGDIGQFAQSIFFDGDRAFIISNGSNLITVVNRYSFEKIGVIDSGLNVPRYGVVVNDKAYVTNQADFNTNADDYVAKIDLQGLSVEDTIHINDYADQIVKGNNQKLYIENAAFGTGNHISIFDIGNDTVTDSIETAAGLNSVALEGNTMYALSSSKLQKIDLSTKSISSAVDLNYDFTPKNLQKEDNKLYFTVGNAVYRLPATSGNAPQEPVFSYQSNSDYGVMYGFAVHNSKIYVADAGDFASDNFIEVHNLDGDLLKKIDVGIAPNGFYFNE